eukprot:3401711-Pyramimonas_sp.AAC.1
MDPSQTQWEDWLLIQAGVKEHTQIVQLDAGSFGEGVVLKTTSAEHFQRQLRSKDEYWLRGARMA